MEVREEVKMEVLYQLAKTVWKRVIDHLMKTFGRAEQYAQEQDQRGGSDCGD